MRMPPTGWTELFADNNHKIEYKLVINSININNIAEDKEYTSENMLSVPTIERPLLDQPAIGRVCSATLTVVIRPYENYTIPKAARVRAYCRLISNDGRSYTDWTPLGKFNVSSRSGKKALTLNCRDDMVLAGQKYLSQASSEFNWPVQQVLVVQDIARIMGVELDDRNVIRTGSNYLASSPDTEALISEILSYIGICNGGNWVITEEGKLRLIPLASPYVVPSQALSTAHTGYVDAGIDVTISRITLTDDNDDSYTAGDDTGYEITAYCPYANAAVVSALSAALVGVIYRPYRIEKAWINPLLELGDTVSTTDNEGNTLLIILNSINASCNIGYTATLESAIEDDVEEEIPYQTSQELRLARSVRTDRSYYGASLNRAEGMAVRKIQNNNVLASVRLNADEMAFYQGSERVLYFDAVKRHWMLNGDIEVFTMDGTNTTTITNINGKTLTIEETVNGVLYTQDGHQTTLIDGGKIYTDNMFLHRLFSRDGGNDSFVEMLDNGLTFILGQTETINIGYYSSDVPLPYMIFGAGSSPTADGLGMIKKYTNGIWIGDAVDRNKDSITRGTGLFIDATNHKIYKYNNGFFAELADTSNVTAVFG